MFKAYNNKGRVVAATEANDLSHALTMSHNWNQTETRPDMLVSYVMMNGTRHNIAAQLPLEAL